MSEELPVEEVISALEDYQRRTIDLYRENPGDPESCVKALVRLHLSWTEEDPERARMVARHRNAVIAGPGRDRLNESNRAYFAETKRWIDESVEAGEMPPVSFNVMHALVFAPTQELAKHWLGGRLGKEPTAYAAQMGEAAWAGLLAAGNASRNAEGAGR